MTRPRLRYFAVLSLLLVNLTESALSQVRIEPQEVPAVPDQNPGAGLPILIAGDKLNRSLSVGVSEQRLSNGFGKWHDQYARLVWQHDRSNLFHAELVHGNRFDESGVLGGLAWTRVLNDDWYGSVGYARTSSGLFWPIAQTYGTINRKWLRDRQLISSFSLGADESRNDYKGRWLSLSASYYAPAKLVFGAGVRVNQTQPGDVRGHRAFGSVTWGERGSAYVSLTYNSGREGYQLLNSSVITNFSSAEWLLVGKLWLAKSGGIEFKGFDYHNPYYRRAGVEAGLFADF